LDVVFRSRKLAALVNADAQLRRRFGPRMAAALRARLAVLELAENLGRVPTTPPMRCHQLHADRDEQSAVDLVQPYRLVFAPNHDPIPRLRDGGIDRSAVTAIIVLDIVDYH
jgi:proteic killer suppression protein